MRYDSVGVRLVHSPGDQGAGCGGERVTAQMVADADRWFQHRHCCRLRRVPCSCSAPTFCTAAGGTLTAPDRRYKPSGGWAACSEPDGRSNEP